MKTNNRIIHICLSLLFFISLASSRQSTSDSLIVNQKRRMMIGPRVDYINKEHFGIRLSGSLTGDFVEFVPISIAVIRSSNDNTLRYSNNGLFFLGTVALWLINDAAFGGHSVFGMLLMIPQLLTNFKFSRNIWNDALFMSLGQNTDYYFGDDSKVYTETVLGVRFNLPRGFIESYLSIPWARTYFSNRDPYLSISVGIPIIQYDDKKPF